MLFGFLAFLFPKIGASGREHPPYIELVHQVTGSFVKKVKPLGFHCTSDGGGMPQDVRELDLGFTCYEPVTLEEAREKLIFLTEEFLKEVNAFEPIRPYLREYPFPESRVSISLSFETKDPVCYEGIPLTRAYHTRSKLFYWGKGEKHRTSDILEESYDEALKRATQSSQGNTTTASYIPLKSPPKTGAKAPQTTTHWLGSLPTDLTHITPGQELAALGVTPSSEAQPLPFDLGELIGGLCDAAFGEDFLVQLDKWVSLYPEGEYIEFWDNKQIKAKIPYKNGVAEGHIHGWYKDGKDAFKGFYVEGKRVGIQMAFYPSEVGKGQDPYGRVLIYDTHGRLDGEQITRSPEGHLIAHIPYKEGVPHGAVSLYRGLGNGKPLGKWHYDHGTLIPSAED